MPSSYFSFYSHRDVNPRNLEDSRGTRRGHKVKETQEHTGLFKGKDINLTHCNQGGRF